MDLESKLDELLELHGSLVVAQCNAGSCGTRHDWKVAHNAEESFEAAREAFCAELRKAERAADGAD